MKRGTRCSQATQQQEQQSIQIHACKQAVDLHVQEVSLAKGERNMIISRERQLSLMMVSACHASSRRAQRCLGLPGPDRGEV